MGLDLRRAKACASADFFCSEAGQRGHMVNSGLDFPFFQGQSESEGV